MHRPATGGSLASNFPLRTLDVKQVTVARCPSCGAALAQEADPPVLPPPAQGGTTPRRPPETAAQALDNLYREVMRLRQIAELTQAAPDGEREARLLEEIWQLRVTVARLRGTSRVTGT